MTIDEVLEFIKERATADELKKIREAEEMGRIRLMFPGKVTTRSVYREVEGHPTNPQKRPAGG